MDALTLQSCEGDCQWVKVIYMGFPGRWCPACSRFKGLASWMARLWFNGWLMYYNGGYWNALWAWLRGGPHDG